MLGGESIARADMGLPMIVVTMPLMVIALIPVIIIEALILGRRMRTTFKSVLWPVSAANLVSTLIGIPVTWILLVGLEIITGGGGTFGLDTALGRFLSVTWQSPWLIPYEHNFYWMIPMAQLVLLIPFFFASYFIERLIVKRMMPKEDPKEVKRGVFTANLGSYALLSIVWLYLLFTGSPPDSQDGHRANPPTTQNHVHSNSHKNSLNERKLKEHLK
jgi:hypothetical protein